MQKSRILTRLAVALALTLPATGHTLTDAQIVQSLEALGEYEAAWPLALSETKKRDDYQAWRRLHIKYQIQDAYGLAYHAAWRQAVALDTEPVYRDFLTLKPNSPDNALAVHAIYQLRKDLDTIEGYRSFIADFPNSVEAVQALQRIHEIAWSRAREADEPEVYDAFVRSFPGAKQIPDAIEAAFQTVRRSIDRSRTSSRLAYSASRSPTSPTKSATASPAACSTRPGGRKRRTKHWILTANTACSGSTCSATPAPTPNCWTGKSATPGRPT